MIEKPSILISSIGKTGTEFFARLFSEIIQDCTSLHEPDIVKFVGVDRRLAQYVEQVRRAGVWRMVFLKSVGKWTLAELSDSRFLAKLDHDLAVKSLGDQRRDFVAKMPGSIYIEANFGYYGLLDITPDVFEKHKLIYVIRDGRDWVSSAVNWGEAYGKKGLRKLISHAWPSPDQLPEDPYAAKWHTLSRFERLCWAWSRLNEYALTTMPKNPDARLFFFEKIYTGNERYQYLDELIRFAVDLPGYSIQTGRTDGWLERQIHKGSGIFPHWENWSAAEKSQFRQICGPLMDKLGYAFE
ncbi:MAG TPA: hypothetical protein VGX03_22045 [Candidatus Binatia bacterium]|nr:hypothetical protein [Candidatus Binatia bacterium]